MKKKLFRGTVIALLLLAGILAGASFYLLDYALTPDNPGKDMEEAWKYMEKKYPHLDAWRDSLEQNHLLKDTFITAPDGIRLHAFYVYAPRPTTHTALLVHGYMGNALRMFHLGYMYNHDLQFNILVPDLRYAGLSEGKAIQMGWLDRLDIMQWLDAAACLFGDSIRTVVHGISMGAATTMMLSGETLPTHVRCLIEDCGYTSVWDEFEKELKTQFHLPAFPLLYTASWLCKLRYGWDFHEASALRQIAKCRLPMFFVHGAADDFVPTRMVYPLYDAKPQPKSLWVVPRVEHARSYYHYPHEYTRKVQAFVLPYLSGL